MENDDNLKDMDKVIASLDSSYYEDLGKHMITKMNEDAKRIHELLGSVSDRDQAMRLATEQTADNTADINEKLELFSSELENYNVILEKMFSDQNKRLEEISQQLEILENIFSLESDNAATEKEIRKILQEQINAQEPTKDILKDKGADLLVNALSSGGCILFNTLKQFLTNHGIILPM